VKVPRDTLAAALRGRGNIRKAADKRFVWGVAYPANKVDGHGEYMGADNLETSAWGFLAKGREIGLYHTDGTVGHAVVVESSIHRGPAYILKGIDGKEQTINTGDWLLGAQYDEDTWNAVVKSGKVNGWSMQGIGKRRSTPRPA
jgi:hypothetical protein